MFLPRQRRVLPGFKLTLGFTLFYLGLIVLIPLAAAFAKTGALSWAQFWHAVASPAALAAYQNCAHESAPVLANAAASGISTISPK